MIALNEKIFYWFNSLAGHSVLGDSAIVFVANDLPWILIFFTIFYFLFFRKSFNRFLTLSFMVMVPWAVTEFLKWVIFRHPRPFVVLPDVVKLINITSFDSFPSGHATVFAAISTGIFIYNRRLGIVFMVATLMIGLARIAAGVHYPFDILTGYAIGFVMAIISYRFLASVSRAIQRFVS